MPQWELTADIPSTPGRLNFRFAAYLDRTASKPIILHPCQDAANEKWTVVSSGGSSIWSIKSDFSGRCLHADPGRVTPGGGIAVGISTAATLVQRPCDDSKAQQFNNVDADWVRRTGPH